MIDKEKEEKGEKELDPRIHFNYQAPFLDPNAAKKEATFINWVFAKIKSIRPAFRYNWQTDEEIEDAKLSWLRAFKIAKIQEDKTVQIGLDKLSLMNNDFIPNPGEFIALCQKECTPQTDTRNQIHFQESTGNFIMDDDDPKKWKPGYVFKSHAHLNSRDKAIPVLLKLLEKLESKKVNT